MPKAPRGRPKTLEFAPTGRRKPLIDWSDPSKQAHVLDWRHRAQEFGLAVETHDELEDAPQPFAPNPEQILHDEEPEAFEDEAVATDEEGQLEGAAPGRREEIEIRRG